MAVQTRCNGIAKSGNPCQMPGVYSGFCLWHDTGPEAEERRLDFRRKGGRARSKTAQLLAALPPPMTGVDGAKYVSAAIHGMVAGTVDPKLALALASCVDKLIDIRERLPEDRRIDEKMDKWPVEDAIRDGYGVAMLDRVRDRVLAPYDPDGLRADAERFREGLEAELEDDRLALEAEEAEEAERAGLEEYREALQAAAERIKARAIGAGGEPSAIEPVDSRPAHLRRLAAELEDADEEAPIPLREEDPEGYYEGLRRAVGLEPFDPEPPARGRLGSSAPAARAGGAHGHGPCVRRAGGTTESPEPTGQKARRTVVGEEKDLSAPVASAEERRVCQGPVMPIGGAEDKSQGSEILGRFVELAGGGDARIAIVPTASEDAPGMGEQYVKVFRELGAARANWLRVEERADANGEEAIRLLEGATGIYITGGDQARLVALMAGTLAMECIRQRNADGVVVAGTSAGASIVGAHLMSGDNPLPHNSNDAAARKGMVELVAGFGLLQDIIIDQHFSQRGRLGRLMTAYAANPGLLGVGLDEDTAVLIDREGTLEVLGSSMVTIVDGRNAVSDYYEREVGEVLTVVDSHLFVLGPGRRFDLDTRRPIGIGSMPE